MPNPTKPKPPFGANSPQNLNARGNGQSSSTSEISERLDVATADTLIETTEPLADQLSGCSYVTANDTPEDDSQNPHSQQGGGDAACPVGAGADAPEYSPFATGRLFIDSDGSLALLMPEGVGAGEANVHFIGNKSPIEAKIEKIEGYYRYTFELPSPDKLLGSSFETLPNAACLMMQMPIELRSRDRDSLLFRGKVPYFVVYRAASRRNVTQVTADLTELQTPPPYRGALEIISTNELRGWLVNIRDLKPVELIFELDGVVFASIWTGIDRGDISRLLGRHGCSGFQLDATEIARQVPRELVEVLTAIVATYPNYRPELRARIAGEELFLPKLADTAGEMTVVDWLSVFAARRMPVISEAVARASLVQQLAHLENDSSDVRLIAFFLPQYHPIPENDQWWGTGFTEWSNVSNAKPQFKGHYQPRLPADLGFYDLRLSETREAQADLAREYGIYGFCYYYYWFSGRKLLDRPLREIVESGRPDFPFCICWANEPWSRRWDGSEQELLIAQEHDLENDVNFISDILSIIKDPRYIRIDGEPLILIYRVNIIPQPQQLFEKWKGIAKQYGLPGLHICVAETFGTKGAYQYGADSAVCFPPHGSISLNKNGEIKDLPSNFTGNVYDYREVVQEDLSQDQPPYTRFRTAMPSWDNTARRGIAGHIFLDASPDLYEVWLSQIVAETRRRLKGDKRVVFVNAWNEWAEGAHLEPDRRFGRRYLEATRRAIGGQSDWRTLLDGLEMKNSIDKQDLAPLVHSLKARFIALQESNEFLSRRLQDRRVAWGHSVFTDALPITIAYKPIQVGGLLKIDQINQYSTGDWHVLKRNESLILSGWTFVPGSCLQSDTNAILHLVDASNGTRFYAAIWQRIQRRDVVSNNGAAESEALWSGFEFVASLEKLPPGEYAVAVINYGSEYNYEAASTRRIVVV